MIYYFIHHGDTAGGAGLDIVYLVLAYLFLSQFISYVKARAEALGFDCNVGLLARPLRMLFFGVPLFVYGLKPEPWVLRAPLMAVIALGLETAVHRVLHVWNRSRERKGPTASGDGGRKGREEKAETTGKV